MKITDVEWLDDLARALGMTPEMWNPLRGCRRASAGCENCYAEAIARRFCGPDQPFEGLIDPRTGRWNGNVRLIETRLPAPARWKKPRTVWINSAFDLFLPAIPSVWLDAIFVRVLLYPKHLFLGLTKHADVMHAYLTDPELPLRLSMAAHDLGVEITPAHIRPRLPLSNLWLGVSVEDHRVVERIAILRRTPAAMRFISFEPLIGNVGTVELDGIGWAIVGGESGTNARPRHPAWALSLFDQCREARVPVYNKQPGEWTPVFYKSSVNGKPLLKVSTGRRETILNDPTPVNMHRVGMKKAIALHPPGPRELPHSHFSPSK